MKKRCSKCGVVKSLSAFYPQRKGRRSTCKECEQIEHRLYALTESGKLVAKRAKAKYRTSEKGLQKEKEWRSKESTKEIVRIAHRKWLKSELGRQYRIKNRLKWRVYQRAYYAKWRKRDHILDLERGRRWSKTEKGRLASRAKNMRRRDHGAYVPTRILEMVVSQSHFKCFYCGRLVVGDYHIDHKIPLSRGGRTVKGNLAIACASCNLSKGSLTDREFLEAV